MRVASEETNSRSCETKTRVPVAPQEVGFYIPEPAPGKAAPQTNDVEVDSRGLVYIVDRYAGFDVLELNR